MKELNYHTDKLLEEKFGIIGKSDDLRKAKKLLIKAAPTELSVLITGETGTGKEIFARAIHGLSKRKNHKFISVNCGAIPESLLESELFGHEKGAYTGASEQRKGFFESADHGTIFLDEIGEMPVETQVKLLRILESGEFSRLGSSDVKKVDVRIIAATNRNLEGDVKSGKFRQDLFFRLRSVLIHLPPLREHPEDILLLFEHFADQLKKNNDVKFESLSADAKELLKNQTWEGNVRELRNLVETMLTLEDKEYITTEILSKYIRPTLPEHDFERKSTESAMVKVNNREDQPSLELGIIFRTLLELKNDVEELKHLVSVNADKLSEVLQNQNEMLIQNADEVIESDEFFDNFDNLNLEEIERKLINHALTRFDGNRRLAANELGISERTLYRKLKQYDLD